MLSFKAIVLREFNRIHKHIPFMLFASFGPILAAMILTSVFSSPISVNVPIAVIDQDQTQYSRDLISMLESTPGVSIAYYANDWKEALSLLKQGKVYGIFGIDEQFSENLLGGRGAVVVGRYDGQFMTQGNTVNKAFQQVVGTYSATFDASSYVSLHASYGSVDGYVAPINVNTNLLYNPSLNYAWFLLLGLIPVVWQLFATGTMVFMFGNEFEHGGWKELDETAHKHIWRVVLGKMVPYFILFAIQLTVLMIILFVVAEVPLREHAHGMLVLLSLVFILATMSVGVFIISVVRHLAIGLSLTSLYVAPAFAYAGVTFPYAAMPIFAKIWSNMLPITHYHKSIIEIAMRGSGVHNVLTALSGLLAFLVLLPIAVYLYRNCFSWFDRGNI